MTCFPRFPGSRGCIPAPAGPGTGYSAYAALTPRGRGSRSPVGRNNLVEIPSRRQPTNLLCCDLVWRRESPSHQPLPPARTPATELCALRPRADGRYAVHRAEMAGSPTLCVGGPILCPFTTQRRRRRAHHRHTEWLVAPMPLPKPPNVFFLLRGNDADGQRVVVLHHGRL